MRTHLNAVKHYEEKHNNLAQKAVVFEEEGYNAKHPCEPQDAEYPDVDHEVDPAPVLVLHWLHHTGDVVDAEDGEDVEHGVAQHNKQHRQAEEHKGGILFAYRKNINLIVNNIFFYRLKFWLPIQQLFTPYPIEKSSMMSVYSMVILKITIQRGIP